ncbi:hypothetical protein H8356DRAFT_1360550 [Neocallimastix lanati (nom. inval.)]|nr:hypothetical protein H8356DRAFT_1360550 [Neocallimastix sp. JGI-2020a]
MEQSNIHNIRRLYNWIWGSVSCNDGTISLYQKVFNIMHVLYHEHYTYRDNYRDNMIDAIIQHLSTNKGVRIH